MNRLINLLLLVGIGVAVIASFGYLELDLGELGGHRLGQMGAYAALPQPGPERRAPAGDPRARWKPWPCRPWAPCSRRCSACSGAARGRAFRLAVAKRAAPAAQWSAGDSGTGVGGADGAGRRPRAERRHPGAGLHTTGVLGRLFAEALENTPPEPAEAIRLQGGNPVLAFCYGTLPNLCPQLLAYSLYRWENNIRMASVLGFVGAGGLGQMLYVSLSLFQEAQASTVILAMLVLVLGVDSLSAWSRQRWVKA
jgi:phosphonate transport system permease protein